LLEFKPITYQDTKDYILNYHYAHRMPSISYAFGLFQDQDLVGVCTFGKPASPALTRGVCGSDYASQVYELNRVYTLDNLPHNATGQLVAYSLRQLKPLNLIIVSYADEGMHHQGILYQATNFLYCGKTKGRTDRFTGVGHHSRHYDKDAIEVYRSIRTSKYRYIYFASDKRHKKEYLSHLNYKIQPYPTLHKATHYHVGDEETKYLKVVATGKIITEDDLKDS